MFTNSYHYSASTQRPKFCVSKAQLLFNEQELTLLLDNLSPDYQKVDPCTSFDHLVCDGFNNRHDIPQDLSSYSTGTIMSENGQTILRHILESPYPTSSEVCNYPA